MYQDSAIVEEAAEAFSELVKKWHFNGPLVIKEDWMTRILFSHVDIGFELELDWRENSAFGLVVRLEDGKPPSGYYLSNGRRCRKHLQNIARDLGWRNDVRPRGNKKFNQSMKADITALAHLLFPNIEDLLSRGASVF
jgi:hypothetical protein